MPIIRPHADLLGVVEHQPQLGVLLDDRNDVAADLLRQHRRLDELGVLEAVADDRRVVAGHGHHGQQLGLAARLEAELIRPAELHDLFDDLPLLIDLDRINAAIIAAVLVLGDRALEGGVNLAQPLLQDLGEADQDRQIDAAQLQPIDQLLQIDSRERGPSSGGRRRCPSSLIEKYPLPQRPTSYNSRESVTVHRSTSV